MILLDLPPELLVRILGDFVGSDFFRENICRITVSRQWYHLVWPMLVSDFELKAGDLVAYTKNEALVKRSQPHLRSIKVSLEGFEDPSPYGRRGKAFRDEDAFLAVFNGWTDELHSSLSKLAEIMEESPRASRLNIKAEPEGTILGRRRGYLIGKPLADLLSITHLTSLDIDTASSYLPPDIAKSGIHLCSYANALLPSLRRLCYRVDYVCEKLLDLPPDNTPLNLEEVIVNLSISHISNMGASFQYAKRCGPESRQTIVDFKRSMDRKATALCQRLHNPRMVRVIWHEIPTLRMTAFEAVTGQTLLLRSRKPWDSEGKVIQPSQETGW